MTDSTTDKELIIDNYLAEHLFKNDPPIDPFLPGKQKHDNSTTGY